jgi:threonine 3-dehydrogenase
MERVLNCMREFNIKKIYFSDSIGSYGITSPRLSATARFLMENPTHDPQSDYGLQKRQCRELLVRFMREHDMDARFVVIPGVLHNGAVWGGGTTEYALDAILSAVKGEHYVCPIREDVLLPMIHSEDLIRGMIALMNSPQESFLPHCRGVALAGFSFTPKQLFDELVTYFPNFTYSFDSESNPQAAVFAVTWPDTLCPDEGATHINFRAQRNFQETVKEIVESHQKRLGGV